MPRYSDLSPSSLRKLWETGAPAIIPWGALEWHGDHLPLGLDGIVAEEFCARLAERVGGVCLPGVWLPITTLPHPASLSVRTETLRAIFDDLIASLYGGGARTICLITGHCAQGHLIEMYEAALRGMDDFGGLRVFAGTPLEPLGHPEFLDHAARYETSQLLAMRPELVDVGCLGDSLTPHRDAVLGEHPRLSSAQEGEELLRSGVDAWQTWLAQADCGSLEIHYREAFDAMQGYVDAYFTGSWDDALAKWWQEKG